jgi:proton-translocating NADH-quinone oxidoreductase chain L
MLILVTSDNFIQMFVGWEGVGLCSYLLINFWFTRLQANKAAIKAMLVNRVGDFGLALGILCIFNYFGVLDYASTFCLVNVLKDEIVTFIFFDINLITLICLLLFVGAVGKSAQLGLHIWLPDAMEGPTPVSALIHAATMVTAGVFLIARCSPLFENSTDALSVVTIFGATTAFFAATTGLLQNDLKRVIAYSTCSQLGYMVFACGLSNYSVGVFHLANHAFFKALLFLGAGCVIHAVADEQDFRKMGGLSRIIPFTYSLMFIGSLSLMGFPFLSGFYSKDVILEVAYAKFNVTGHYAFWAGTFAAFFTAFYSIRLLFLTFLSETNGFRPVILNAHDGQLKLVLPLAILAVPSIFIGYLSKDMIIGFGTNFWQNSLFTDPVNTNIIESEFIPISYKLLPLIFSLSGALSSYILYSYFQYSLFRLKLTKIGNFLYHFLNKKWWFDKFYNEYIAQPALSFGYHGSYKTIDRGIIEILGPFGISFSVFKIAFFLNKKHTGFIYHYIIAIFFGLSFILVFQWLISFSGFDIRLLVLIGLNFFI